MRRGHEAIQPGQASASLHLKTGEREASLTVAVVFGEQAPALHRRVEVLHHHGRLRRNRGSRLGRRERRSVAEGKDVRVLGVAERRLVDRDVAGLVGDGGVLQKKAGEGKVKSVKVGR